MKALDLYKFVKENELEYQWDNDDVILFVSYNYLLEWCNLLGYNFFVDDGLACVMEYGYIGFKMKAICEHFGIELREIFEPIKNS